MARTHTASRAVPASPERVYAALIDPDALTARLPPEEASALFEHFDARPGGSYRMVLTYDDAAGIASLLTNLTVYLQPGADHRIDPTTTS